MRILHDGSSWRASSTHREHGERPTSFSRQQSLGDDLSGKVRNQNWMLDIYQILDVHAKGKVQWRLKDLSIKDMEKRSYGAHDYVMGSFPYHRYELEQEQKRETHRIEDKKPTEISWSCKRFNPKELVPYWPDFKEEHV